MHVGLAEQGKLHAVRGEHALALTYYREALRLAVGSTAPEVFFRHYMECTLESLERMECYAEVLEFCERAVAHHASHEPVDSAQRAFAQADLVYIHQRKGLALLKSGRIEEAREALAKALARAREAGMVLALAETVFGWLARGLVVDARRVLVEQEAKGYFTVRADNVDARRAIAIPAPHLQTMRALP